MEAIDSYKDVLISISTILYDGTRKVVLKGPRHNDSNVDIIDEDIYFTEFLNNDVMEIIRL